MFERLCPTLADAAANRHLASVAKWAKGSGSGSP